MLWIVISILICWLIYRELTQKKFPISKPYILFLCILALSFAWSPIHMWYFERSLTRVAKELSENNKTVVHCNTLFDTLFDEEVRVMGHCDPKTAFIVIQYPGCSNLMAYLKNPTKATLDDIIMLNIVTHESMHARGETVEAKTECQAVQRNYRAAKLLGLPDYLARKHAVEYYKSYYLKRNDGYFSKLCEPENEWDEHLSDSTWNEL